MSFNALNLRDIAKSFGAVRALDGVDLDLADGVLMALLGPSGCGKTTALRVMAGFESPERGTVVVRGEVMAGAARAVPPERRRIGMVFQDWALFPHLDVWNNVAFGVLGDRDERVREVLELVHLSGLERRMPHELSGGQQQRVALARALAPRPAVVLLDEPFSNLDASLRAEVRADVRRVLQESKSTAIFVTHDQEEALSIADEVAVMDRGRILQVGSAHEVYRAPINKRVATLVGEANFFPGEVRGGVVTTILGDLPAGGVPDGQVDVMVRPEGIRIDADPMGNARIVKTEFYGHDQLVRARLDRGGTVEVRLLGPRPELAIDSSARVTLSAVPCFFPRQRSTDVD